ncbi:TIGR00341 family protein [Haloplanus salinarum]|uniref:TIGR00341 family protein n=1 Tax=Haloplanus salinarum TaxID=1912324 RepID=UPI00214B992C|nr:TIGR00341 family protein [Haloplanus salinarum]
MRLVQVMVPPGKRDAVLRTLDDEGIDYVVADETSHREYTASVTFPLPQAAVEPVLERLHEAGLDREAYTVVLNAETVISRRFDDLVDRYEEGDENGDRIAREELAARARSLAPNWRTFVVMTVVSSVVATAGLLLDSAAVVVGSMVIAPLIGPAMATSTGSVVDDRELLLRGVKQQVAGGVLAVLAAAAFAVVLRATHVVPLEAADVFAINEVRERLVPDVLSLVIALGAGVAGALSLSTGVSTALVGVMIAAALVPPTAVVGIGLAWGSPRTVTGALVLVLVNFLSINFAALAVLWATGYRPKGWLRHEEARVATLKRIAALGAVLLVLSTLLAGITYSTYRTATFEEETRVVVDDVLGEHASLERVSLSVTYEETFPFTRPEQVTVVVGHPPGVDPPTLAGRFAGQIDAVTDTPFRTDRPVAVEVRYVVVERSTAAEGTDATARLSDDPPRAAAERASPGANRATAWR